MTKTHFIALAEALRASEPASPQARAQWLDDIHTIANVCQDFNPRFDRDLWTNFILMERS